MSGARTIFMTGGLAAVARGVLFVFLLKVKTCTKRKINCRRYTRDMLKYK